MINADTIGEWIAVAQAWAVDEVLVFSSMVQLGAVAVALVVSLPLASRLRRAVAGLRERFALKDWMDQTIKQVEALALPLVWLGIQWLVFLIASGSGWERDLLEIVVSLLTAWVVIRFASTLISNRAFANCFAIVAWTVAALSIVDLLDPVIALLDGAAISMGGLRLSLLGLIKGPRTRMGATLPLALARKTRISCVTGLVTKSSSLSTSTEMCAGQLSWVSGPWITRNGAVSPFAFRSCTVIEGGRNSPEPGI